MRICVYSASGKDLRPEFVEAARELGRLMGERGWDLVFGGGTRGLMGHIARAIHAKGGHVTGVIPEKLNRPGIAYEEADELIVTQTMRERKHEMDRLADAFIALPGGFGTLEELIEAITLKQLGYHNRAIVLLNVAGFYDPLMRFFEHQVAEGLLRKEHLNLFTVALTPQGAIDTIAQYKPESVADKFE